MIEEFRPARSDEMKEETVTLYHPTGPAEFMLVKQTGFKCWPPRLLEQPIFYAVTNEEYARQIAAQWSIAENGVGHITRFYVRKALIDRYEVHQVGGSIHPEWWIPAQDLDEMNRNIIGAIEVIGKYPLVLNKGSRKNWIWKTCFKIVQLTYSSFASRSPTAVWVATVTAPPPITSRR